MEEKRVHRRFDVKIPAGVYFKDRPYQVIDAEILDLSAGGAFVSCPTPVKSGEEVFVEIRFGETWFIEGTVVRNNSPLADVPDSVEPSHVKWSVTGARQGFGIEFTDLSAEKRKQIQKIIAQIESFAEKNKKP